MKYLIPTLLSLVLSAYLHAELKAPLAPIVIQPVPPVVVKPVLPLVSPSVSPLNGTAATDAASTNTAQDIQLDSLSTAYLTDELARETDESFLEIRAEYINTRIGREAYLASQREATLEAKISSLKQDVRRQEKMISNLYLLVDKLEAKIDSLENG